MQTALFRLRDLGRARKAASLTEYGMTVGLISVLAIGSVIGLGERVQFTFLSAGGALSGAVAELEDPAVNPNCYRALYLGTVGQDGWSGCGGHLIVDTDTLRAAASSAAGGDESFAIDHQGETYTFADGARTVFTGQVTDFSAMFRDTSFNGDITHWDLSAATSVSGIFANNPAFDQPIGAWNTAGVTDFSDAFNGAAAFNRPLADWDVGAASAFSDLANMFRDSNFNQPINGWCVDDFPIEPSGFRTGAPLSTDNTPLWGYCASDAADTDDAMVLTIRTTPGDQSASFTFTSPDLIIDWGDGNFDIVDSNPTASHTYAASGATYTVRIAGTADRFGSNSTETLRRVNSFGDLSLSSLETAFENHTALTQVDSAFPSSVTNMRGIFASVTTNPTGMEAWDTSNVSNMRAIFYNAANFNRDISGWDTSGASTLFDAFNGAAAFNQDIGDWDVSGVSAFLGAFRNATSFDQDLSDWDVSNVGGGMTGMAYMFENATSYGGDMSEWCVINQGSRPTGFSNGTQPTTIEPLWGSCP